MRPRPGAAGFLFALLALTLADQPARPDPPKKKYVFVENTDRWVRVTQGEWQFVGKLDKNGDFAQEFGWKKGQEVKAPQGIDTINFSAGQHKRAYEFRSGMLIPGELQPDGRFVPEVGGKIIPFKDYQYSPSATRIWNLPGFFVTEDEAAELKKAKPADKK